MYSICEKNGRYKTCKIDKKNHLYLYTIRPAKLAVMAAAELQD